MAPEVGVLGLEGVDQGLEGRDGQALERLPLPGVGRVHVEVVAQPAIDARVLEHGVPALERA